MECERSISDPGARRPRSSTSSKNALKFEFLTIRDNRRDFPCHHGTWPFSIQATRLYDTIFGAKKSPAMIRLPAIRRALVPLSSPLVAQLRWSQQPRALQHRFQWSSSGSGRSGHWRDHLTAVNALIVANVTIFGIFLFNQGDPRLRRMFQQHFILSNRSLRHGHYSALLGHMFMHVDIFHLLLNMITLQSFGSTALAMLGTRTFLGLYTVSGLVGGLAQLAYCANARKLNIPAAYYVQRDAPVVGASGAIAGIVTYACLRVPTGVVYVLFFPVPNLPFVFLFLGGSLYFMYAGGESRLAHASHLGGSLCGLALWLLRRGRY